MIKTNSKMRKSLAEVTRLPPLNPSLRALLKGGFHGLAGCQFLSGLHARAQNVDLKDFSDAVGLECFINSIHIDDYIEEGLLSQAIAFVQELFETWKEAQSDQALVAIISAEEDSVVVKFHLKREDQQWLKDDLDGYLDAILQANSTDDLRTIILNRAGLAGGRLV